LSKIFELLFRTWLILAQLGLGHILGNFFSNSSGRPGDHTYMCKTYICVINMCNRYV
jgi:hypothetical protein